MTAPHCCDLTMPVSMVELDRARFALLTKAISLLKSLSDSKRRKNDFTNYSDSLTESARMPTAQHLKKRHDWQRLRCSLVMGQSPFQRHA